MNPRVGKSKTGVRQQSGFTLIELMIVVAMIALLTTIALPSYRDYVTRSGITDATSNLATKRVQIEQFFQDARTYVGATGCTADSTTSKYFNFSCSAQTASAYTLQAVGKGSMSGFTYTIDQSNVKATAAVPGGWSVNSPNTCWVIRKGGSPC